MAEYSLWRAARWKMAIYLRGLIPITTQLALRRNTRKIGMMISKSRRRITRLGGPGCLRRDESRGDEVELQAKRDDLDAKFGHRGEEDRTVARFALANPLPLPLPPMPFFPSNNQRPSPEPFLRSPTAGVFSIPNTIHTNSSSTPPVYGSHPCLMPNLALFPPSLPIHKEREKGRRVVPSEKGELSWSISLPVCIRSQMVKVQRGTQDQRRPQMCLLCQRHHVLKPTPPLPTHPSVLTMPSAPVMMASGSMMTMPTTLTKGGATLMSRIGSVEKWGMRRRKETSSTLSEVIGGLLS